MKPIYFDEHNVVYAEGQPEYKPLPAFRSGDGIVVSCWKMGFRERMQLLFTGKIWLQCLTFDKPLQPILMGTEYPFKVDRFIEGYQPRSLKKR
jgi:hypothetical protein